MKELAEGVEIELDGHGVAFGGNDVDGGGIGRESHGGKLEFESGAY
jgi:hypothetical protein